MLPILEGLTDLKIIITISKIQGSCKLICSEVAAEKEKNKKALMLQSHQVLKKLDHNF